MYNDEMWYDNEWWFIQVDTMRSFIRFISEKDIKKEKKIVTKKKQQNHTASEESKGLQKCNKFASTLLLFLWLQHWCLLLVATQKQEQQQKKE